jgi:sugar-specific transcriptional regulator TrmB
MSYYTSMNIHVALKRLGLSASAANVYLFLLQHGRSTSPQIQSALTMDKVVTYRALSELESSGYIERLGATRGQQFVARPIEILLERYDQEARKIAEAKNDVEMFMKDVVAKRQDLYKQHNIQVYEGVEGYRVWMDERLSGNADVIREYGRDDFVSQFFAPDEIDSYMDAYIQRRVAKSIHIQVIADAGTDLPKRDYSDEAILKQTRTVAMPAHLDGFMSVFGNRVGFYTKQSGEYLGIIIEDSMLASMMKIFFDSLWSQGKEV